MLFSRMLMGAGGREVIMGAQIKSIQQLEITIDAGQTVKVATISEVVMVNTLLLWGGFTAPVYTSSSYPKVVLTNGTTVTATKGPETTYVCNITVTVVEFEAGGIVGVQRGVIVYPVETATITEVNLNKAFVVYLGATSDDVGNAALCRVTLTNSTTVTVSSGGLTTGVSFEVIEFL